MKNIRVEREGKVLLAAAQATENAWERMAGLLPKSALGDGEGLWIAPCTSVHTFFMRFPIDVAFLDRGGRVIAVYENLKPWRLSGLHLRAAGVLEATAGAFAKADIRKGEVLKICATS